MAKFRASYTITLGMDVEVDAEDAEAAEKIAHEKMQDDGFTDSLLDYFSTYDGTDLWHAVRDCDISVSES